MKDVIAAGLEEARRRSLGLLDPLPAASLRRQHSPLMSPLVWDLAHVGNYEEMWLLRETAGLPATSARYDEIYDPFRNPRGTRSGLPILGPAQARAYVGEVRGRALDVLDRVELDPSRPLLAGGYVYGMVIQHEHQHDETMLATLQLMEDEAPRPVGPPPPPGRRIEPEEVRVEGGPFVMGTDVEPWAYDNERPAHVVDLPPFYIDTAPVTNRAYAELVAAGAYHDPRLWSVEGWAWRQEAGLEHPQFWQREGDWWSVLRMGSVEALEPDQPVQHVCWYEADAYARWAGKRLPTEAEWEKAASWEPGGRKRRYPWGDDADWSGRANLGQRHVSPAPVGAYPGGASPWGCEQMVGDVWEWTSSDFVGYPGFRAFPYREYSDVFYGSDYKVLRGGSWATHPSAIRATFRNWDFPIRRQIFAGLRCARDA